MKNDAEFSTRLKWFLLIVVAVLITLVGLLLLYYDVSDERMDMPVSQDQPATEVKAPEPQNATPVQKLDLNLATKAQLETLPGIGKALAERIVAFREKTPFKVVRDLKKIPGIGEATFQAICGLVVVNPPAS